GAAAPEPDSEVADVSPLVTGAGADTPSTERTRLFAVSAIRVAPFAAIATATGALKPAAVAGPPSPLKPAVPVPATVVIAPPLETLRMRLLPESAIRKLP